MCEQDRDKTEIIRVTRSSFDETMTYEFSVDPKLKDSVYLLLNNCYNDLSLANRLCQSGILEFVDSYV